MTIEKHKSVHLAPGRPESPTGASSPAEAGSPGPGEIVWVDEPGAVIIVGAPTKGRVVVVPALQDGQEHGQ